MGFTPVSKAIVADWDLLKVMIDDLAEQIHCLQALTEFLRRRPSFGAVPQSRRSPYVRVRWSPDMAIPKGESGSAHADPASRNTPKS